MNDAVICIVYLVLLILGCLVFVVFEPNSNIRKLAQYGLVIFSVGLVVFVILVFFQPGVGEPWSTINHSLNGV